MDAPSLSPIKKRGRPRTFADEERKSRKNERNRLRYQADPALRQREQRRLTRYYKANRDKRLKRFRAYYTSRKDDPEFREDRRKRSARYNAQRKKAGYQNYRVNALEILNRPFSVRSRKTPFSSRRLRTGARSARRGVKDGRRPPRSGLSLTPEHAKGR
jgi:hypothetical protein